MSESVNVAADLRVIAMTASGADLDAAAEIAGVPPRDPGEPDAAYRTKVLTTLARPETHDERMARYADASEKLEAENERRMAACPSPESARALLGLMQDISEEHYCAGWMVGLERSLWAMLEGGSRSYGQEVVSEPTVAALRRLSIACDGWWMWPEEKGPMDITGETFVRLEEWRAIR